MNIDYSICHALGYKTQGMATCLVCYDVGCQWSVNFLNRVKASEHLSLPPKLEVISAVGKFHLGAHVPECFALYSLNFVEGAGQQDGEIIETLWSGTNCFSGSLRAMGKAHRHEVLDDIMRDSNWKKMVNMGKLATPHLKPEADAC
jgi:Kyakuja-Dileera-Zisupton transposase